MRFRFPLCTPFGTSEEGVPVSAPRVLGAPVLTVHVMEIPLIPPAPSDEKKGSQITRITPSGAHMGVIGNIPVTDSPQVLVETLLVETAGRPRIQCSMGLGARGARVVVPRAGAF